MGRAPPTPPVFVSADSKRVAGIISISADSAGLKVHLFSMSWKWVVSADSKGVPGVFCLIESKRSVSAYFKGLSDAGILEVGW